MKNKIKYEVQYSDDRTDEWRPIGVYYRKKDAKDAVRDFMFADLLHGMTLNYRIVKLTIKKEVVK
jgi:hypothetical protein